MGSGSTRTNVEVPQRKVWRICALQEYNTRERKSLDRCIRESVCESESTNRLVGCEAYAIVQHNALLGNCLDCLEHSLLHTTACSYDRESWPQPHTLRARLAPRHWCSEEHCVSRFVSQVAPAISQATFRVTSNNRRRGFAVRFGESRASFLEQGL